jgi:aspartate/glutamate racemase
MERFMALNPKQPVIGILVTDAVITRPPGDVGNPATYPFPVLYQRVPSASLERIIEKEDPELLRPILDAARELVKRGAAAITSTCGFMILYQRELAQELPVPVFLSSLLQLPFIRRIIGPEDRIGIITAHAMHLTPRHLRLAGLEDMQSVKIIGLENRPAFREAIFAGTGGLEHDAIQEEVVEAARELIRGERRVKAILLECSNLPPYAAAVQKEVQVPVFDFNTMIHQVYRAIQQSPYPGPFLLPKTSSP